MPDLPDLSHLNALRLRRSHEACRFAASSSPLRKIMLDQLDREIASELVFLGLGDELAKLTDEELLDALKG